MEARRLSRGETRLQRVERIEDRGRGVDRGLREAQVGDGHRRCVQRVCDLQEKIPQ